MSQADGGLPQCVPGVEPGTSLGGNLHACAGCCDHSDLFYHGTIGLLCVFESVCVCVHMFVRVFLCVCKC